MGSFLPNIWHTGGKRQKRQHCHKSQGWNAKLYVTVAVFVLSACGPIVWQLWLAVDACFFEAVKSLEAPKWQLWNGTPTGWWWVTMDIFFDLAFGSSTWNTFKENSDIPVHFWHNLYALSTCLWRKSFDVWILFGYLGYVRRFGIPILIPLKIHQDLLSWDELFQSFDCKQQASQVDQDVSLLSKAGAGMIMYRQNNQREARPTRVVLFC